MSACNDCWDEAFRRSQIGGGHQAEHYELLLQLDPKDRPWCSFGRSITGTELLTCSGCGTTYDATDADVAGRCVHDNLCRRCWAACDRGRSCRDGCHERGER